MSKSRRWLFLPALGALLLLVLLGTSVVADDPIPPWPHKFYGTVMVGGEDVPAGSMVSADGVGVVPDTEYNPIVTDEAGVFGNDNPIGPEKLTVLGSRETIGQPLMFYVNGVRAETETSCQGIQDTFCYDPGEITELGLSVPVYDLTVTAEGCAPVSVVYTPTIGSGDMITGTVFSDTVQFAGISRDTVVHLTADVSDPCCGFDSWLIDGTDTVTDTETISVTMDADRMVEMTSSPRAVLQADILTPTDGQTFGLGETFEVTAEISNTCTAGDALSVTAELSATEGVTLAVPAVQTVGDLDAGESGMASWTLTGAMVGDAAITVLPDGVDAQVSAQIAASRLFSDTIQVTITEYRLFLPIIARNFSP